MNIDAYRNRLKQLLVKNYELLKTTGRKVRSDQKIEGYMEAGLSLGVVSKNDLERIIDEAHSEVFSVPFVQKVRAESLNDEILDIPTWIRDKKDLV